MKITRDVIADLLPAYVSGESSADTRALVDEFLREDPGFAATIEAARGAESDSLLAVQPPLEPNREREALERTRALIRRRGQILAAAVFLTLVPFTFIFNATGVQFFMLRDEPRSALFWIPAAFLWFSHVRLQRRLQSGGL